MFSPVLPQVPGPAGRIFELLTQAPDRCAAIGALRIPSAGAAQAILPANVGVALNVLSQPARCGDPSLSQRADGTGARAGGAAQEAGYVTAGARGERPALELAEPDPAGESTRFGSLARSLWAPLLAAETQGQP